MILSILISFLLTLSSVSTTPCGICSCYKGHKVMTCTGVKTTSIHRINNRNGYWIHNTLTLSLIGTSVTNIHPLKFWTHLKALYLSDNKYISCDNMLTFIQTTQIVLKGKDVMTCVKQWESDGKSSYPTFFHIKVQGRKIRVTYFTFLFILTINIMIHHLL